MCLVLVLSAKALSIVRPTQIDVPAVFEGHFGMGAMAYYLNPARRFAISGLDRLQSVNLAEDVVGQIL